MDRAKQIHFAKNRISTLIKDIDAESRLIYKAMYKADLDRWTDLLNELEGK